jgi:hypothetical protein
MQHTLGAAPKTGLFSYEFLRVYTQDSKEGNKCRMVLEDGKGEALERGQGDVVQYWQAVTMQLECVEVRVNSRDWRPARPQMFMADGE